MIVSAGWYIALVSLWPADSRPYIAGSTDNSLLQLAFGYNGIERIAGNEGGGPGGGGHGPGTGGGGGGMNLFFGGEPGIGRLFGASMGAEASWLLPAALIGLVVGLWLTWRAARTDRVRAGLLLWGGWLLVTGAVFSFMAGTVHPYYNVALAPAVAALVGIAVAQLVARRDVAGWPALRARRDAGGHRRVVVRAAEPDARVVACAALGRARRVDRGGACCSPFAPTVWAGPPRPSSSRQPSSGSVARRRSRSTTPRSAHSGPGTMSGPQKAGGFGFGGPGGPVAGGPACRVARRQRRSCRRCSRVPTTVGPQRVSARCR